MIDPTVLRVNCSTVIDAAFSYWAGVTMSRASRVIVNAKMPFVMRSRFALVMGSEIAMVHSLYRVRQEQVIVLCFKNYNFNDYHLS